MMGWPKQVPVWEAKDIWKSGVNDDSNTANCCAFLALRQQFGGHKDHAYLRACKTLGDIAGFDDISSDGIISWNDNPKTSRKKIAEALNEVNRRLGYTEVFEVAE